MARLTGIDVSRWQGIINWPIVAKNVAFAIIKLGGSDDGFYSDGLAVRNAIEARVTGLPIGFYVYLGGASSVEDEVTHIKNLVNNIGGLRAGEFFALDWEESHAREVDYVYGVAKGLIDAGFNPPLIYMSLNRIIGNDWKRLVSLQCGLWVAAWGDNDSAPESNEIPRSDEWPFWAVWQYSSTGSVPGIKGRVDMNQFNGTLEQLKKYGSQNKITMPTLVSTSRVVLGRDEVSDYIVQSGDTLSAIATRFGKRWQDLWTLNRDLVSNPNRIFTGQKLRVWSSGDTTVKRAVINTPVDHRRYHVVANGENLSVIASKFGLPSWVLLYEANKNLIGPDPNMIRPGQKLIIP